MTYTIDDKQSMALVVDDESEADTNFTTVRHAVITKNGQILPAKSIFPEVENFVIIENLVQGTFQVKVETITGAFIPDQSSSSDSLDAVATYVVSKVSQVLSMTHMLNKHTKMVMWECPDLTGSYWIPVFTEDDQIVPTSFILPGVKIVYISKDTNTYYVDLQYHDNTCAPTFISCHNLDEVIAYITSRAREALKKSRHVANKVSQALPTAYVLDNHTQMVMSGPPNQNNIIWTPVFTKDGQIVPTSSILPGIEEVMVIKASDDYGVTLVYTDGSCDNIPGYFCDLDDTATYLIHLVMQALKKP